jgi:hypothetical protein
LAFVLQRYTTTDNAAAKIVEMQDQYATVRRSLVQFQESDYEEFYKACNIDPSEGLRLLNGDRTFLPKGLGDFFRLGMQYIVLLDLMVTKDPPFEVFYHHLCILKTLCEKTGKSKVAIIKSKVDQWIKACQDSLGGSVSESERTAFRKDLEGVLPHLRA